MSEARILLVDDDEDLRPALVQGLEIEGFAVDAFSRAEDALSRVTRDFYGVVVSDIRMPGIDGMAFLRQLLEIDPALPVVLITGHGEVALAVEAMRDGAYDFIEKPFPVRRLTTVVERAVEKRRLVLENRVLRERLDMSGDIGSRLVGRNPAIGRLREEILALAGTDADVLVLGETGSGKEVVARALHDFGSRSKRPFRRHQLRCAAARHFRERAVRPRGRRLHRRAEAADRQARTRQQRHGVSRRNRIHAARPAGQAVAHDRAPQHRTPRVEPSRFRSMCASSPRPRPICARRATPSGFGPTCSTG